jgi:PAS domain S-box-containing protein
MSGKAHDTTERDDPPMAYVVERFFELSLDMHVIASPDGFFKHVSDSAPDILGFSVAELVGHPFLEFIHPDDHAATLREVERQIGSGEKVVHFENRYRHKDGSWRVLAWKSMPADGLMYATARDVTDLKRVQQELVDARNATEAANRDLEAFSYSVAHDLRAPLRGIDGFSQALLEEYADRLDDEGRRWLDRVRQSAQHMAQLIDDLLMLSRVTRSDLKREAVDLAVLAAVSVERLERAHPARRVAILIEPNLVACGDARLLGVVLDNLIANAWKYSSKREAARIEVGATRVDDETHYFVRDNGAGFDMTYAHKLFGVFERLHVAEEYEGTGIGLATVRRIVERHGGRVWAHGEVDRGATFSFSLGRMTGT